MNDDVKVQLETRQLRLIPQLQMSSECWPVQFQGLSACTTCEARDTNDCGGPEIRKTGKNEKGFTVPLGK